MIFVSGWGDRSETDIRNLPVGRRQSRVNRYSVSNFGKDQLSTGDVFCYFSALDIYTPH
jgi:hypothetical protein